MVGVEFFVGGCVGRAAVTVWGLGLVGGRGVGLVVVLRVDF